MPTVISVKFKYAARDLWFDPGQTDAQEGDHVICATERGTEIGLATGEHLHFELLRAGERVDPAPFLRGADSR